jgi:SAM-dependent methyltransferase
VSINQDQVFADSEGDRWFRRNRAAVEKFNPDADLPLRLLDLYHVRPRTILEVGASSGFRLAALAVRDPRVRVVGCEPSGEAIAEGRKEYPAVEFVQGTAAAVPLNESFELVILNFVFHWIDRSNLLRSVAEVDRLVADGGLLLIGDFFPAARLKVRYHHRTDVEMHTYKQNYATVFLASGQYQPVCLLTAGHATRELQAGVSEDDRISVWLLRKSPREAYAEREIPAAGHSGRTA